MDIELVKDVIVDLNKKSGKIWASFADISKNCITKYGLIVTKKFFINNADFRIYRTSNLSELYVSLSENIDMYLISKTTVKSKPINKCTHVKYTQPKPTVDNLKIVKRLSYITSSDDLEQALIGILKDVIATSPYNELEVMVLAKYFCQVYGSPIKPVLNSLIPGLSLIQFLQCSKELIVKEVNDRWIICLK